MEMEREGTNREIESNRAESDRITNE
jgi:hypothetical protein